jgi:hypothetical protein
MVKRLKLPKQWGWRILAGSIVIFSLLAYGLALYQKGASLSNDSISIIQIDQDNSSAHITTYMGLFVPNQGDFDLRVPGENLTQPVPEPFLLNNFTTSLQDDPSATILSGTGDSNLNLHNLGPWTFHPIVSEQDRQLRGGLSTHLALSNNRLVGTISNMLDTPLSDLYVLLSPHSFVRIGHLAAGETQQINLPLSNSPLQSGQWLNDQIATHGGLPAGYFPHRDNQQPQTDFERHMALLSALSGTGFAYPPCNDSCYAHAITSRDVIFATGGNLPNPNTHDDFDPLLIPGSQATLIGWTDQQVAGANAVTINSALFSSHHDNFIQMPLNIAIASPLNIPPDFITGHAIGVQGYDAQVVLPGIYRLANGSISFELRAPDISHLSVHGLTITEPDLLAHPTGPGSGSTNPSHLKTRLYNWHTGSWDEITLHQDTFTTTNIEAYIGLSGRVLVQVISENNVTLYFSKPSLTLNA